MCSALGLENDNYLPSQGFKYLVWDTGKQEGRVRYDEYYDGNIPGAVGVW